MPRSSLLLLAASALAAPADDGSSARCTLPDGCPPVNGSQWVGVVSSGSLGPVPSLLLIGTRKGGTTSLSKQLLLHPVYEIIPDHRQIISRCCQRNLSVII